ncbi:MAG: RNA 3'-terminal phosphate cyclase [Candidatus Jordarchaeales archaeon]
MNRIRIDGSLGEGGGQVLRTSVALSALSGKTIEVFNIRAKRPNPGLRAQHMTGIKAVAEIAGAKVTGLSVGSTTIVFEPAGLKGGKYRFDVGTAGSVTLVLQSIMPAALFAPENMELEIRGGTDVAWSPPVDYFINVVVPNLRLMGYVAEIKLERRGHYPKGGGLVRAVITPVKKLKAIRLMERGEVKLIEGVSHAVNLPAHVAERQARSAEAVLKRAGYDVDIKIDVPREGAHLGPGSGIVLWAKTKVGSVIGADSLGEKGKPAEKVGEEAAQKILEELESGAPLDRHMGDMIIPFIAIADGTSEVRISKITMHLLTNIMVTEKILGVKFQVEGREGEVGVVKVNGLGLENPHI